MREALAVVERAGRTRAVAGDVLEVEDRAEAPLHVGDMLADPHLGPGARLQVGRRRKVVGVGVGLEHPVEGQPFRRGGRENPVRRRSGGLAGAVVEVEHRVDGRRLAAGAVPDQVADGVRRLVEEGLDREVVGHRVLRCSGGARPALGEVELAQPPGHRPRPAVADRAAVDLDHRGHEGRGGGDEGLGRRRPPRRR